MNAKQLADKHGKTIRLKFWLQRNLRNVNGLSSCGLCGRTWNICKPHDTPFSEMSSCFPLCEDCWPMLTPEERLPYYEALIERWKEDQERYEQFRDETDYDARWIILKKNVLAGL